MKPDIKGAIILPWSLSSMTIEYKALAKAKIWGGLAVSMLENTNQQIFAREEEYLIFEETRDATRRRLWIQSRILNELNNIFNLQVLFRLTSESYTFYRQL